jgi:O-antigen/teichoic acid export membrane protein
MNNIFHQIFTNTILAFFARSFNQLGYAIIFIVISRSLGAVSGGIFTLALRLNSIFLIISLWGLDSLLIRDVAIDKTKTEIYFRNFLPLRILLSLLAYSILTIVATFILKLNKEILIIALLLSISVLPEGVNSLLRSTFVANEIFIIPTIVSIITGTIRAALGIAIIVITKNLLYIAGFLLFTSFLGFLIYIGLILFQRKKNTHTFLFPSGFTSILKKHIDLNFIVHRIKQSIPFAVMEVFITIELQVDVVLLSVFLPSDEVGYFAASQTIVSILMLFLYGYHSAIYPLLSRLYATNKPELWKTYQNLMQYGGIVIFSVAILLTLFSKYIILNIFTSDFVGSVLVVQILIWALVLQFINEPHSRLIVIYGYQNVVTYFLAISMIITIILNILLIPQFGIQGSAFANLISKLLFTITNGVFVFKKISDRNPLPIITKLIIATILFSIVFFLSKPLSLVIRLTLSWITYLIALLFTKLVSRKDYFKIKSIFSSCVIRFVL